MILWGIQKQRSGAEAPEFLQTANPRNLIIAGVITLGLTACMMLYWNNYIWMEIKRGLNETSRQLNLLENQSGAPAAPSDTKTR